jgi:hypothetical protein
MATTITQFPKFTYVPVGQDIIFIASNLAILTTPDFINVKYIAEVHISDALLVNPASNIDVVGTFKTTPNNAGVGIFNFRSIVESYLNTDNNAKANSSFKEVLNTDLHTPLHLIDKFSGNNNSFRYLFVKFKVEYIDNDSSSATFGDLITPTSAFANSNSYNLFNAYLKYSDELEISNDSFGYNLSQFNLTDSTKKFLTNAPSIQYANIEDYGTAAILMINPVTDIEVVPSTPMGGTATIRFTYYEEDGTLINYETIRFDDPNTGGFDYADRAYTKNNLMYAGVSPANLRGWSTIFNTNIDDISYYTFVVQSITTGAALDISQTYTVNINCPTLKGYEPIRLTWLNQWGAWDYYTFNMKSIKNISTKGSTYQQLEGTWNESSYKLDGFRGGKKAFRVNATEKITMNTDFVSETESEWFEELINSPEVYILKGFGETVSVALLNNYVTPVRLTTSSYTKKTVANDKLMQYTFEVEKSKTLRTQSV